MHARQALDHRATSPAVGEYFFFLLEDKEHDKNK